MTTNILSGLLNRSATISLLLFVKIRIHSRLKFFILEFYLEFYIDSRQSAMIFSDLRFDPRCH
jgi:hypothetical protein